MNVPAYFYVIGDSTDKNKGDHKYGGNRTKKLIEDFFHKRR